MTTFEFHIVWLLTTTLIFWVAGSRRGEKIFDLIIELTLVLLALYFLFAEVARLIALSAGG